MNKKTIIFLVANIPVSFVVFYLLTLASCFFFGTNTILDNLVYAFLIFSIIVVIIDSFILKDLKSIDLLTVLICAAEVSAISIILYWWLSPVGF